MSACHALAVLKVSEEWVRSEKQRYTTDAKEAGFDFLSTNDLLTSWFFNRAEADAGMVQIDCRGRIPGLPAPKDFKPGSYISAAFCLADDFRTPVTVRRRVTEMLQAAALSTSAPAAMAGAPPNKLCNVTNWSSVYHHLEFPGCRHAVHYPLVASEQDATHANLYLFRPRSGELAALVFEHRNSISSALADGESPFQQLDSTVLYG